VFVTGVPSPIDLAAGDFNGDGVLDLAAAGFTAFPGKAAVAMGSGGGLFGTPVTLTLPMEQGADSVSAADFDGDGRMDLLAGEAVLFGDGAGGFPSTLLLETGSLFPGMVSGAADLNGDGRPEVLAVESVPSPVRAYLFVNRGGRKFLAMPPVTLPDSNTRRVVTAADLNRDGIADLVTNNVEARSLSVLPGLGDGRLGAPFTAALPAKPGDLESGDLDGDGAIDLVAMFDTLSSPNPVTDFLAAALVNASPAADITAPAAVADLAAANTAEGEVLLTWTAPGGDGALGRAALYDVRRSPEVLTPQSFGGAERVAGAPAPSPAGTVERLTVGALPGGALVSFALKAGDAAGNVSGLSNAASVRTLHSVRSAAAKATGPEFTMAATKARHSTALEGKAIPLDNRSSRG
jgi:hypothetical protein